MTDWKLRRATLEDIGTLMRIEQVCFSMDRLNRRQFKWMLLKANANLVVAEVEKSVVGYLLVLFHRGTSLARLYSLAVLPEARGKGLSDVLMNEAERVGRERNCIYMRLEVHPKNSGAIKLYERHGYHPFAHFPDYYEDHSEALRFEKRIFNLPEEAPRTVPFYQQTMAFTCGPSCLIMAMRAQDMKQKAVESHQNQVKTLKDKNLRKLEIQLWREATTIYMTSGHGGCSPQGIALAAWRRGFKVELFVSQKASLFLDGVRKKEKKEVMQLVHEDFTSQIHNTDIQMDYRALDTKALISCVKLGGIPLVLISSYRFNSSKAPHWVVMAAADEHFVYLHDPDVDIDEHKTPADNMYIPVDYVQFDRMTRFGQARTQAAVIIYQKNNDN